MKLPGRSGSNCEFCGEALDLHSIHLGRNWCLRGECSRRGVTRDDVRRQRLIEQRSRELHPEAKSRVIGVVPANRDQLEPLPPDRRAEFEAHLATVIETAFHGVVVPPSPDSTRQDDPADVDPPPEVVASTCAICRGYCCNLGRETAFLSEATVRRYRAQHPGTEPETIRHDYLSRLPDESFQGSCVYHGERGCTLPRTMRADLCNTFLCRGLRNLGFDLEREKADEAVILAMDHEEVVRHGQIRPE